jgi:polysaccharide biosynthesis protein PslH
MRILQLHNKVPYPPKDGGAIGVWNFTVEFAKQGHDVTLLAMNTKKHFCNVETIPEEICKLINIVTVNVDALITFKGVLFNLLFSTKPYNAQRFISNDYTNKLIEILTAEKFDVIILEGLYMCPYISIIRKFSKAKIVFKAHNVEHEIWSRVVANEPSFYKREYLKILSRRIRKMEIGYINKADSLVTFTERDAQFFNSLGNKLPYYVAPAGIDTSHLVPDKTNTIFPSVFYIGALDWAPNQEALMWFMRKVWPSFYLKFPEIKLEIAGRNAPDWFKKFLLEPNVVFLGEITDAYSYMNSRAIMIVPLLSGSGMRIKIVEGMALGKIIITTSIGTEGIETTHNQDILIADTAEQYQKQLERAINDKPLCDAISFNAIKFVKKNFNINQITKELTDFLERQNRY